MWPHLLLPEVCCVQVLVPRRMELCLRAQQLMGCLPALPEGAGRTRCCRQGATRAPAQHQPLRWQRIQVGPQQKEVILHVLGQLIMAHITSQYCHVTRHVCRDPCGGALEAAFIGDHLLAIIALTSDTPPGHTSWHCCAAAVTMGADRAVTGTDAGLNSGSATASSASPHSAASSATGTPSLTLS